MPSTSAERIRSVRAFNRFYTKRIGLLGSGLLGTAHPLPQARILFELGRRDVSEVADLRRGLELDRGYLSRLLGSMEADGLIARDRSPQDARRQEVRLTEAGAKAYAELDARSSQEIRALLEELPEDDQRRLLAAMQVVEDVLGDAGHPRTFTLRHPRSGDYGWVVQRHGALYSEEYGWDESFEALVARIVANYIDHRDPRRECAWIAEAGGRPVGCVFCVRKDDDAAQLRLLLVEPAARGMGIGTRLVDESLAFARQAGYSSITLWTNDVLHDARRIYERAGFTLAEEQRHHSFGHDLVGQHWSRGL